MSTKAIEVRDRSADTWIKVLGLVAVITLPLVGAIGGSLIRGQERTNEQLANLNGYFKTHESRISRNELDISSNSKKIYTLEGLIK